MDTAYFIEQEKKLLSPNVRRSAIQVAELLSDDFEEVSQHGLIYIKQDIFNHIEQMPEYQSYDAKDFVVTPLCDTVVKVRYLTESINTQTGEQNCAERVSIWRKEANTWRMVYHQGTPIPA